MTNKRLEKIYNMTKEDKIKRYTKLQEKVKFLGEEIFKGLTYRVGTQGDIINYMKTVSPLNREAVSCIFLNSKNVIVDYKIMSEGTLTQSVLYPREIAKNALAVGALGLIICHNHPSGDPAPSENDRKITRKLLFAVKELDINLLDHMIIGAGEKYYSFYEEGLIEKYNANYRYITESEGN